MQNAINVGINTLYKISFAFQFHPAIFPSSLHVIFF